MEMTGAKREDKEYISYEDFLALCDEDTLAEWVNGKIERYLPASDVHQDLAGLLLCSVFM